MERGADVAAPALAPTARSRGVGGRGPSYGHLVRQPERGRRQDDLHVEPRRRAQGEGAARARRRPRPAGQPDDEPGVQPGRDHSLDVRRARASPADRARDPGGGDRHRGVVDRPRRRRARAVGHDRPRALPRAGVRLRARALRLRPRRHAAVARSADDQRPGGVVGRDRARSSASTCRCAASYSSRTRSR